MKLPHVSMICAMTPNRVIGNNGTMPWRIPRDLKHFRKRTRPNAVVMGPKTFASIGKPLPERLNIVLTTDHNYHAAPDVLVAHDPRQALELAAIRRYVELFVIGGAMVYTSFLPMAEHLFVTYVWSEMEGDTHFPYWDKEEWHKVFEEEKWRKEPGDEYPTKFAEFRRKQPPLPDDRQTSWRHPNAPYPPE